LTLPTEAEIESINTVNREDSFTEIPLSESTIEEFKKFFNNADNQDYTTEEVIYLIQKNYNPEIEDTTKADLIRGIN